MAASRRLHRRWQREPVMIGEELYEYTAGSVAMYSFGLLLAEKVALASYAEPYLTMKIDLSAGRDSSARGGFTRHRFHCASCRTSDARHLGMTITTISAFGNILTGDNCGGQRWGCVRAASKELTYQVFDSQNTAKEDTFHFCAFTDTWSLVTIPPLVQQLVQFV